MRNARLAGLGCLMFVSCGDTSSDSSNNPAWGSVRTIFPIKGQWDGDAVRDVEAETPGR
jgi:hypothetical protein